MSAIGSTPRAFLQVDVFSHSPGKGNAVAVIGGDGLSDVTMATVARWTNLSETVFLLPASAEGRARGADYRVRIFTPNTELPFAGHPTLGSAAAWTALNPEDTTGDETVLVQECAAGLIPIRRDEHGRFAFRAPALRRSGPVSSQDRAWIAESLDIVDDVIVACAWTDNGPGWVSVRLADAQAVLALRPAWHVMAAHGLNIGVCGVYPAMGEHGACLEVRAFCPGDGRTEDPVTGSLNAALAQWLQPAGVLPAAYTARQGRAIGFDGYIHIRTDDTGTWVSGDTTMLVTGTINLAR